ncbi:gephyrin-like molybdotransferase Glp [Comamonas denitrificans]|uniref:molybdopterin molybdotransferase MoeA n=1 Tax=Comamonas denitrificans TaxID=117506 RepID=UPI002B8AD081|nr:molybdopterin molybdotransferase MoeA [Comamonas denitrificans]
MSRAPLTPLEDALAAVLAQAQPLPGAAFVDLLQADGRVLAADCIAPLQVPPLDNSAMDGYAVRSAEVAQAGTVLPVSQRIPAGQVGTALQVGTVARIFTGAPLPPGADAIVMQEDCTVLDDGRVRFDAVPQPGQFVRRAGQDIALGSTALQAGLRLTPAALGLAASLGLAQLPVARRPRVALFSTGDELALPGSIAPQDLPPGHIFNSNRYVLASLLQRWGCEVVDGGILPDDRVATHAALAQAAQDCDLLVTSAGVSVGEEDHVRPVVEQLGALSLWKIAMKPGKPFAFGHVRRSSEGKTAGQAHFIGLPGNPVSSLITALVLLRPFVLALQGASVVQPPAHWLTADFEITQRDSRREFLRARRNAAGRLELFANQNSGVLTSTVWAEGLVDNPAQTLIARGDRVRFLPFSELLT